MNHGKFVISLDFELMWGVIESRSIEGYGENILGVHKVIPRLLDIFNKYGIKGTFSTVGFLFFENKKTLLEYAPKNIPAYKYEKLSPYNGYMNKVGQNTAEDPWHFAAHLVKQILEQPQHELGTHTFSHYFCLEEGQTIEQFREDLKAAQKAASLYNVTLSSLIFPRNQFDASYLEVCKEEGIVCYRGNPDSWLYKERSNQQESNWRRALRLADAYVNISGHHCHTDDKIIKEQFPINLPGSRFLRPYNHRWKMFEWLRLQRIKKAMTHAAKTNTLFHLWWHPHNFGVNQEENFAFLEEILKHYQCLHTKYGFRSYTMTGLAQKLMNG
ncbi:MAG: polysaccharide deacetylase family protein [Ferruginibacter sp.]